MKSVAGRACTPLNDSLRRFLLLYAVIFTTFLFGLFPLPAKAQERPIILKGDAVVTGYSGVALLKPAPGAKPADYAIINRQGATLQVFDLSQMFGRDDARLVNARRFFSVTAGQIGQVFGVALDDGRDGRGPELVPNIYTTATSVFGLQIVKTAKGVRDRAKTGGANRTWMDGQFGAARGGGPGSIWKIDGRTGQVSLFANVTLNGLPNSGPALGNITFDSRTRKLFVSDLQTGMIHAFNLNGAKLAIFDHGAVARPRLGLPPIAYDAAGRVDITNPAFDALNPATWGFADMGRKVWGLAMSGGRLFYSVAEGPEIWSVGIRKNGTFANDARVEIQVQASSGDPISDIAFGRDGAMYVSQRGQAVSSYDYTVLAKSQTASVLRYRKQKLPSGEVVWQPAPDEYAVGFQAAYRNANGGVALGYGYDRFGYIRQDTCQNTLWSTGELLRQNPQQTQQLKPGGPMIVHGLQGNALQLVRPANEGPFKSYFIDFDSNHADPSYRGHMGDVEIWSSCPRAASPKPKQPSGPRLRIAKSCSAAIFGGGLHCRVTLTNSGSQPPKSPVSFTDIASLLDGPPGAARNPLILSATPDDPAWTCSSLPARSLGCTIEGAVLKPGHSRSVELVTDVSQVVGTLDWRVRNCATLDGTKQTRCVTRGDHDALIVAKSGPFPQTCIAGGPCDFEVTVINPGKQTFDGNLFFSDNLTIGGAPANGIIVDGVWPNQGCAIHGLTLPLQWQCHTTIPPGGYKLFTIQLTIPAGAVPAGITKGRNCFVLSDPNLMPGGNAVSTSFWGNVLNSLSGNPPTTNFWGNILNPANNKYSPGKHCIDFDVQQGVPVVRGPGLPLGVKLKLTTKARPSSFSQAGQVIYYSYQVRNTGAVPIASFALTDTKVKGVKCPPANAGPNGGPLAPGASATCIGIYLTKGGDVGNDITATARITGKTAIGIAPRPQSARTVVKYIKPKTNIPAINLTVTPAPTTFSSANQKIGFTYTIKNTGAAPFTSFALFGSIKGQNIKCPPANTGRTGGPLAAGATATCKGSYTTTASDAGKDITKYASVTGVYAPGRKVTMQNVQSVVKFVKPQTAGGGPGGVGKKQPAILSLRVAPAPTTFSASGQTINYTYKLTNNGKVPVTSFRVIDSKAGGINCNPNGGPVAPGASVVCTGSYQTIQNDVGRNLVNNASLYGKTAQGRVQPAGATGVVTFVAKPSLDLVMRPQKFSYTGANQQLGYDYVVTNTGSVPITAVSINDSRVPNINCGSYASGLNPGAQLTCNGSYITNSFDVGNDIKSIATVSGTTASGAAVPADSDDALVKYVVPLTPKLDIVSISPQTKTFTAIGQNIVFTFTVENVGNVLVGAFRLTLPPERGGTPICSPVPNGGGPLAIGAKTICQITYTTTQADVARGTTVWDVELNGKALLAPKTVVPLNKVTKTVGLKSKPGGCPPGDFNCENAAINCGVMEPKWIYKDNRRKGGFNLGELADTRTNRQQQNYKAWYTGCRGNSAFAGTFPYAGPTKIVPVPQYLKNAYRNRGCDIYCSQNHARRQCKPKDPGLSSTVVDEIPPSGSALSKQKILWVCPWKITKGWTGVPSAPVALLPPTQDSTFCWKPGGSGGCPSGYTDCGLGCQQGGSLDCGLKIANQVFDTLKAIPVFGNIVGGVWSGIKKLFGFGRTATKTVSHIQKANIIKNFLLKRKAYRSAKKLWAKTQRARYGWKAGRGIDLSSSLVNRATGSNIPRIGGPGSGQQGSSKQKFWGTLHDMSSMASLLPGPVGKIAGLIDAYADPECKR